MDNVTKTEKINRIKSEEESKYNFRPEINQISKKIKRSINDLTTVKERPVLEKKDQECVFKPKFMTAESQFAKRAESNYSQQKMSNFVEHYKESQEQRMLAMKNETEYNQLKDCSFKPKVSHKVDPEKANKQVEVRGMNS